MSDDLQILGMPAEISQEEGLWLSVEHECGGRGFVPLTVEPVIDGLSEGRLLLEVQDFGGVVAAVQDWANGEDARQPTYPTFSVKSSAAPAHPNTEGEGQ